MLAIVFPQFDPVILSLGVLEVRWYSIAYIVGIVAGYYLMKKYYASDQLKAIEKFWDDLFVYNIMGIILGGRLGFVIFYNPMYYLQNPLEIIQTWHGGMSFHGGLLGLILANIYISRKYKQDFFYIVDLISLVAPIGIFFGRIANFINGELIGRPTDLPFGILYPHIPFARHPSQLYEAFGEGFLLFIIMNFVWHSTPSIRAKRGCIASMFVIFYGCIRFILEFFRMPDSSIGFIYTYFTLGQIYSIFMIIIGFIVIKVRYNSKKIKFN